MRIKTLYKKSHKTINKQLYKLCNKCNKWFPCTEEYFYQNCKNKNDGLFPYCKKCAIKKTKIWVKDPKNKESIKKAYTKKNHNKKYKIKIYESTKKRLENGKYKEWQRNNTNKIRQYQKNREMHKKHTITEEQWVCCKNYFNNCCAYCGLPIEKHYIKYKGKLQKGDFHKEHVIHNGKNDLSNCVPSCKECNSSKNTKLLKDWYNPNNKNFDHKKLNKILKWLNKDYKKY